MVSGFGGVGADNATFKHHWDVPGGFSLAHSTEDHWLTT